MQNINQNLEHLFTNQKQISSKVNKFTTFANHLTEQYKIESEQLHSQINSTIHLLGNLEKDNEINLLIQNEILYSQRLLHTVRVLERTITLAFNGITNLELFSLNDLQTLYDHLSSIYTPQELIKLDLLHPFKILEFSKFYIIFANNSLAFILKLPVLSREPYEYSRIYPIPNKYDQIIIPEKTYHLTSSDQELWTNEACQQIEDITLCTRTPTSGCHLVFKPKCRYAKTQDQYQLQTLLQDGSILVTSTTPQEVIESCNNARPNRSTLTGSYIVVPTCRTIIGDIMYSAAEVNLTLEIPTADPIDRSYHKEINIESTHLQNIQQLQEDLKEINEDNIVLHPVIQYSHYSITGLLLLLSIIITTLLWKHRMVIRDRLFQPRPLITLEAMRELLHPDQNNIPMNVVVQS